MCEIELLRGWGFGFLTALVPMGALWWLHASDLKAQIRRLRFRDWRHWG